MKSEIETNHTPGPWTATLSTAMGEHAHITGAEFGRRKIGAVYLQAKEGESEANAALVAAAPELLEALTYTNLDTDHDGYFCNCPLADGTRPDKDHATSCLTARAAISKSKGTP